MNMKKTKTTYGVYNLIEWHAILRMGKATVKVPFTGGSITKQGVTPATFTTDNPVTQFAIERSPEFLNGKIKIVRRVNLNGVVEIERNSPKVVTNDHKATPTAETTDSPVLEDKGEDENGSETSVATSNNDTEVESNSESASALTPVEFSCNDDAKDYLEQTFGLVRSKLRNREDIVAAGKAQGVEIMFM